MLDRGSSPVAGRRHRDLQEPYRHPAPRLPSIQATRQEGRPHCRPSFRPIPHVSGRRPMAGFPRLSLRAFCREPRTGTGRARGSGVGLAGKIGCALPVLLGEPGDGVEGGSRIRLWSRAPSSGRSCEWLMPAFPEAGGHGTNPCGTREPQSTSAAREPGSARPPRAFLGRRLLRDGGKGTSGGHARAPFSGRGWMSPL